MDKDTEKMIKLHGNAPKSSNNKKGIAIFNGVELLAYEDGRVKENKLQNIVRILRNDPLLKGAFKYNEFTEQIEISRDIPKLHIKQGSIADRYYSQLLFYIECNYNNATFKDEMLNRAVEIVATDCSYNPVKDYMEQAFKEWDEKSRLDHILDNYLGADYTEYLSKVTRLWFVGGVARVYQPSIKFDYVLDLVGGQGIGKTTFLQNIAPYGYYTDQFNSFTDKDDLIAISDAVIINDDEMSASSKMSFRDLKKFITAPFIEYRPPYAKFKIKKMKNNIIARTTNELYYLKDVTGSRRFMPVLTSKSKQKKSPIRDLTKNEVKQIWGEAVSIYKNNIDSINNKTFFELSKDDEKLFKLESDKFRYIDGLEADIDTVVNGIWHDKDFFSYAEMRDQFGIEYRDRNLFKKAKEIFINKYGFRETKKNHIKGLKHI